MSATTSHTHPADLIQSLEKKSLDRSLAILFWPLMLILAGVIWLFPEERVPNGTWLLGIGLILLGLNAIRFVRGIPVRALPTLLGALALGGGLAEYAGANLPLVSLTFIAIGASIVFEVISSRKA